MDRRLIPSTAGYYFKAKQTTRSAGVLELLRKIVAKTADTAWHTTCSIWLVRTTSDPCAWTAPRVPVTLDYLDNNKTRLVEWLRANHALFPWMFFPREIESAIENGHIFVAIKNSGAIIGYLKIGVNEIYIHDFDRTVIFPPDTAFVYDTFVLPFFRNKGIALYAIIKTTEFLKACGYARLWCHIEKWNTASLRIYRKAGFKEKGTIRFSTLFTLPLFIKDGYKPFSGWQKFLAAG